MPHTLLLADDSVTIQRVIELTFADEDVNVVAVSDGDQAIARLDAQPPDIVLADVGMPGKSGYEVAQYVKQSPRLSHIPVVLLTGAFEPVDQARAAQAGCDGVLAKPFEPQLVIGRVKELLGQAKAPAAATVAQAEPSLPVGAAAATQPSEAAAGDLSNYFDRLDAAFATPAHRLEPAAPTPADEAPLHEIGAAASADATHSEEGDWFGAAVAASEPMPSVGDQIAALGSSRGEPSDLPLTYASPHAAFDLSMKADDDANVDAPAAAAGSAPDPSAAPAPTATAAEAPEVPAPAAPAAFDVPVAPATALPPLADAFAALLAAEQGHVLSDVSWPVAPAWAPTDDLVDRIARRVLDQVGARIDASVRSAVADLVSQLAERLIREEIDHIKASLK